VDVVSKPERRQQVVDAAYARALPDLEEARCAGCAALMFKHGLPVFVVMPCRRCGAWNLIVGV